MAVKNLRPVSISSASVAFSSPYTSYRAVNYPAFGMFKELILPLLNGHDTVSQPLMTCIPGNCRHLEPSNKHIALITFHLDCRMQMHVPNPVYQENKYISIIGENPYYWCSLAVDRQSLSHLSCHARSHHYSDCQLTCLHPCQGCRHVRQLQLVVFILENGVSTG